MWRYNDPKGFPLTTPSGRRLFCMTDRVQAFKELMRRANHWGGKWVLCWNRKLDCYIAQGFHIARVGGFVDVATCVSKLNEPHTRVKLIPQ